MDVCAECGFSYEEIAVADIATAVHGAMARYGDVLDLPAATGHGTVRPEPGVWSAVEYACHVRDVLLVQRERALLALVEDNPSFSPIYREERVALAGYGHQPVATLVGQLTVAADLVATVFAGLSAEQAARPCIYTYPQTTQRDVTWLGRHTVHELVHHLGDIQHVLERFDP